MYWLTWIFARILGITPVVVLETTAQCLAVFAFDILRIRRSLILNNIAIAFPEMSLSERARLGRSSLKHFVMTMLETFRGGNTNMLAGVTFRNPEIMDEAMAQGKGVYLLCTHCGNFEVLGAAVSTRWRPATVPVKHVGHGGFDRYVHEQRVRYNLNPIRRTKKGEGYLAIRKALAEGRPVGFMLDQARPGEPRLPLFGKLAKTNTSLAAIWRRCEAPLIPLYCRRTGFGKHEVVFLPEVKPVSTGDADQDVIDHSLAYNKLVEQIVRACPEQYWWIHNRWK